MAWLCSRHSGRIARERMSPAQQASMKRVLCDALDLLSCIALGVLVITLTGVISGCTAHRQPSKVETTLANMAKDVVIPIEAEGNQNPLPDTDEVMKQGQQMFLQSCALCHGTDGHGRTDLGRNMYPPAMDMTSPHVQHWSDAQLFWIIQNGVRLTGMPSWKSSISDEDTWRLAHFIHHLPRLAASSVAEPIQAPPAAEP